LIESRKIDEYVLAVCRVEVLRVQTKIPQALGACSGQNKFQELKGRKIKALSFTCAAVRRKGDFTVVMMRNMRQR
jgi:hypothetical protein